VPLKLFLRSDYADKHPYMSGQPKWPKWVFIFMLVTSGTTFFKLGESYFFRGGERDLAGDGRGPDLSSLEGAEFMINARLRVVEGLRISVRDGHTYLTAGHFLGPNTPTSLCATYPEIEYEFVGADQASSGDPATLILTSVCEAARGGDRIEDLEVPVEKILGKKPKDTEFQVYGKRNVNVKLSNIGDEWPREWSLRELRYFNSKSEIRVEGVEAYRLRGAPVIMKW
jgi:hypothetical protein